MLPNTPCPAGCSSGVGGFNLEVIRLIHLWCLESIILPSNVCRLIAGYTPPKTNISSGNQWLEDSFSFWDAIFSGAMLASGRVTLTAERYMLMQSRALVQYSPFPTFTGRWCCPQLSSATSWKAFMNLDQYGHVSIFLHPSWLDCWLFGKQMEAHMT